MKNGGDGEGLNCISKLSRKGEQSTNMKQQPRRNILGENRTKANTHYQRSVIDIIKA